MAGEAYLAFEPADEAVARQVGAELERHGWSVVAAGAGLRASERAGALHQAVCSAGVVIAFASPAVETSEAFQREIAIAMNNGGHIVVAVTGDIAAQSWAAAALDLDDAIDLRAGLSAEALGAVIGAARRGRAQGRSIAMLNIKGGVGKTVLAANLFAAAHLADKRAICFIDLDPQHNLTQYFLSASERHRIRDRNHTLYGVLNARGPASCPRADFGAIAIPLNRSKRGKLPNFELIAGDERLFEFTLDTRSARDKAEAFSRFRALVAALRARADAVVIDANPCATFLTRLAIANADHIVAPVRPEKYSLTGLNMLEAVVREVRGRPLKPSEFSVLLNGVNDRTRSDETASADARTRGEISAAPFFGAALLVHEVPYAAALKSAPSDRLAANPINVTAMMRVGGRAAKEALTAAAAAILRRTADAA